MVFSTGRSSYSSSLPFGALSPIPSRLGPVYLVLHSPGIHRFATAHHSASVNPKAYGLAPALRQQICFLQSSRDATRKTGLLAGLKGMDGSTRPYAQTHSSRIPMMAGVRHVRVLRDASQIDILARAYYTLLIALSKATVSSSITTNGQRLRRTKEFRP